MSLPPRVLLVCSLGLLVGCAAHARPDVPPPAPLPFPISPSVGNVGENMAVTPAPSAAAVARAKAEFAVGQQELQAGHMVAARQHFDAAIDVLLDLPTGARSDPATSAAYDQLLDRISALELIALRDGDGLTESRSEPAAIDELLSAATFERPRPAATTAETVEADLARTPHDLEIPVNPQVLSFVELFQGRLHDFMAEGLTRSRRYLPMIRKVFAEEQLPLDLAYVPLVESGFKPTALSHANARGMWQFMLGTAREHGLSRDWFIDERADPLKATEAAASYLKDLGAAFDGDWNLALASYNAGPGRIQRAVRRARTTDYWKLTATSRYLPRETREYVPMVMAAIIIAKNPALYGFDVQPVEPLAYERVTVPGAIDLKILAEWSGVTVDTLRTLNPELRRTTTPMGEHDLKVPVGTAATIRRQLASADGLFVRFTYYTVRRGDTLSAISRKYHVSLAELREANQLGQRSLLHLNQTLMIPQHQTTALPASASRTASARREAPRTYLVRRGDTLFGIARRFDTTVASIKQINRLRSNLINVGDRLTVRP